MSSFAPTPVHCANGHPVDASASFCSTCGQTVGWTTAQAVPVVPDTAPSLRAACPNGHEVAANSAFCSACGAGTVQVPDVSTETWTHPATAVVVPRGHRAAKTRRGRAFWIVSSAAVLVLAGGGSALAYFLLHVPTTTIAGSFSLYDYESESANCVGQGGYSDIAPGTTVVLSDETGNVLGSGTFGTGAGTDGVCTYRFTIDDVPMNAKQYVFEVTDRGKVINTRQEMSDNGWTTSLTLGD